MTAGEAETITEDAHSKGKESNQLEETYKILTEEGLYSCTAAETLILAEESLLKMLEKQNDPIYKEKNVNISPINYHEMNKLIDHFGIHFVLQKQLYAEQAFWLPLSNLISKQLIVPHTLVKINVPKELPKEVLVYVGATFPSLTKPSENLIAVTPLNKNKNLSKDLKKLKPKADIGIFVGYALAKKAYQIYNRRTRRIMETIHVVFDELIAMAFEQFSSGPKPQLMNPRKISSGLVQKPPSPTPHIPPTKNDWKILFQPLLDEYFNPPPSVASPVLVVVAPEPIDPTGTPFSTSIDQDAPSPHNDPFFGVPILEPNSEESSSRDVIPINVHSVNQPLEHLKKWTKDHPLDNVIGNPFCPISIRHQLQTEAMFCYFDAFLTTIEPKNYKEALKESCWIEAMQEELNEFERLKVWELVPRPDRVMIITLKWIYKVKLDELSTSNLPNLYHRHLVTILHYHRHPHHAITIITVAPPPHHYDHATIYITASITTPSSPPQIYHHHHHQNHPHHHNPLHPPPSTFMQQGPMTKLTQKSMKFDWGEKAEAAFQLLKQKLCSALILALPEGSENFVVLERSQLVRLYPVDPSSSPSSELPSSPQPPSPATIHVHATRVNSGPRLEFYLTLMMGMRLLFSCLISRSMISTGSSTKWSLSSIRSSSNGITSDLSDKRFFKFDTWNVL
uniref:Retroviral polymerase SH3-like domain-containing protein n=2 Tax=Tanacetum cinerariifolium TaxID=118510 RepID=A0A6L2MW08_TANCI|nr:hypothetical protein [Tanacetum cinerariifolium]